MNLSSGPVSTAAPEAGGRAPSSERGARSSSAQSRYGNSFLQSQRETEPGVCEETPEELVCEQAPEELVCEQAPEELVCERAPDDQVCEAPPEPGFCEQPEEAPPEPYGLCTNYGDFMVYPDSTPASLSPVGPDGDYQIKESDLDPLLNALQSFHSMCYAQTNFQPSTGPGIFDVGFEPGSAAGGELTVSVRFGFNFVSATAPGDYPGADPADLAWTDDAEKEKWKTDFFAAVSGAWSGAHTFQVMEPYWDFVRASVAVSLYEDLASPHYTLTVQKIPAGEWAGSDATAAATGSTQGTANLDSEDLTLADKGGGNSQRGAVHEFGHMIGLGDEYAGKATPRHNASFESAGGATIATGDDDRMMSGGESVLQEHYITFLEGLRSATSKPEWGYTP